MTRDLVVLVVLGVLCGLMACVHISLLVGLFSRTPRWRGFLALLVPFAAPILGAQAGLWVRSILWGVLALVYVLVRIVFRG